jgi:hypothetical protein
MLPQRASERVVIYVVDTVDVERLQYDDSFDPRLTYVAVVDATTPEPRDRLKNELDYRGLLIPGTTLIQNPYRPDEYATISDAEAKYALDKFVIFSTLCQLLGARSVQMQTLNETKSGETRTLTVGADNKIMTVAEGSATIRSDAAEKILSQKDLLDTFQGAEPDIEGARDLLRTLRLQDDPILRSLVDLRAVKGNPHKVRRISVDLTEETNRVLSLAARATTPTFFRLQADASTVKSESTRLRVDYVIEF